MGKVIVRIDDRLIHGQIIAAWSIYLNVNRIIGIDDKTANNVMLKQIMTMSVPKKYHCDVVTFKQAKELLKEEYEGITLVILRSPEDLALLEEELQHEELIIVGNVSKKENSIYEMNSGISVFYLTQNDYDILHKLNTSGHQVNFQTVPNSNITTWDTFEKDHHQ